ncbi:MAG: TMEM175 family protein [Acidimicrobiales bacterium]
MRTGRLEAFSDAVIAILITIMVLELKIPHGATLDALRPLLPIGLTYVLSFAYLAIYWNNHHHMLQVTDHVNGTILWANMHLLFWLSLVPVATGWMGENGFKTLPTVAYGVVLLLSAVAYYLLQSTIIAEQGPGSKLRAAVGKDWKGRASPAIYVAAIGLTFADHWVGLALYVVVALMWLVPDRRLERTLAPTPEAVR